MQDFVSDLIGKAKSKDFLLPLATCTSATAITYILVHYYLKPSAEKSNELEKRLEMAQKTIKDLESKLLTLEQDDLVQNPSDHQSDGIEKKEIRIWMDGAFDMMHFGHMNAFRQARALGTYLIAGINSDETITACKGKPVCSEQERIDTVRGCKWVDEVVPGVPYIMNEDYLHYVFEKYKIDYVVHGDDPCIVDGKDVYEAAVKSGKYLTIPRTEGISTTDIVGRMLLMTRAHHANNHSDKHAQPVAASSLVTHPSSQSSSSSSSSSQVAGTEEVQLSEALRKSRFLTTSRVIRLFGAGVKAPQPHEKVIYLAGAWDMFHAGHIEILEKAKALGDYVIVGVYNDETVNAQQGMNLPIMNLHERVLSVLGCKYVDDVLIDAPYVINQEMLASLHIHTVAYGVRPQDNNDNNNEQQEQQQPHEGEEDPNALPRKLEMLQPILCTYNITALDMVDRIQSQQERYHNKFVKKMAAEHDFYRNKYHL